MSSGDDLYELNEPNAVSETVDGEAIAINLATGRYYSMDGSAAVVWEFILSGRSVAQIIDNAASRYDGERAAIVAGVEALLAKLRAAGLIVLSGKSEIPITVKWQGDKLPFSVPVLQEYDDMQEMLLADPIHDVESMGWPHRKQDLP